MSMVASDVATIPSSGFQWYVIFLEDYHEDHLKAALHKNFLSLGYEVGPNVLVIRGFNPKGFYESAFETTTLYTSEWNKHLTKPALLVTDTAPTLLWNEPAKLQAAKIISIPLAPFREKSDTIIVELLRRLVAALRDDDAVMALQRLAALQFLESATLQNKWGWLRPYNPEFWGLGEYFAKAWIAR